MDLCITSSYLCYDKCPLLSRTHIIIQAYSRLRHQLPRQLYPSFSMTSQQGLPSDQRFKRIIDYKNGQKEAGIEAERAERQGEVLRLGRDALQEDEEVQKLSPAPQILQRPQRLSRSGGRTISELDSDIVTPEASRPAPLPTPPTSPITSKKPIKTASAVPLASTTESQDIAHLHAFLQDCQSQIDSLTLELKDSQNELQGLRNKRQKASNEYLRAICGDVEEEIEKYKRREEKLVRRVEEKEQAIERLEKRIDEGRERERELEGRLAEAEAERRAKEGEDRLREAERRARGG